MSRATRFDEVAPSVLEMVFAAESRHAKPPSVRDLADAAGVAVATMHSYLTKLSEDGLLEWRSGRHRSLRLTDAGRASLAS
jgi:DNA-binding MarR family transcriptional regulator